MRNFTDHCSAFLSAIRLRLAVLLLALSPVLGVAQIIYGVGTINGGTTFDRIFIINPTTGLASTPTVANSISPVTDTAALAVSPLNGFVYVLDFLRANPRLVAWNPATGLTTLIGPIGTPAAINNFIRATFCPDGRFYVAANGAGAGAGAEIYQINPANGALIRTIVLSNIPGNGSGDIVCVNNGDMYVIAQATAGGNPYQMYRLTAAQLASTPAGFTTTTLFIGNSNIANTQGFNGAAETPSGQLIASVAFAQGAVYSINPTNFVATTLTTTDFTRHVDLSRGFPLGISVSKSQTPTSLVQGTQTVTYTVDVRNFGPAVAGSVSVVDTLPAAFQTVTWVCGVLNAGLTTTVVTTACAAASGTGNLNTTASLSINGTVRYTITAVLPSTFTGTLTNVANGTVSTLLTVVTPTGTISTVTATVQPAANLAVTKTDGVATASAGGTVTYTVTFSNFGPGGANGAVIQDTPGPGLASCTVVSCTPGPGGAACPAPNANLLSPTSLTIATFPANSSLIYVVRCRVSATGL